MIVFTLAAVYNEFFGLFGEIIALVPQGKPEDLSIVAFCWYPGNMVSAANLIMLLVGWEEVQL